MEEKYRYFENPLVREHVLVGNDAFNELPITKVENGYRSRKIMCDYKSLTRVIPMTPNVSANFAQTTFVRQAKTVDMTKGYPTERIPVNGNIPRVVETIKDIIPPTDPKEPWITKEYDLSLIPANVVEHRVAEINGAPMAFVESKGMMSQFLNGLPEPAMMNPVPENRPMQQSVQLIENVILSIRASAPSMQTSIPGFPSLSGLETWLRQFNPSMGRDAFARWSQSMPYQQEFVAAQARVEQGVGSAADAELVTVANQLRETLAGLGNMVDAQGMMSPVAGPMSVDGGSQGGMMSPGDEQVMMTPMSLGVGPMSE